MAKVSRWLSQTMLTKRTRDTSNTAALGLIATSHGEESGPLKLKP